MRKQIKYRLEDFADRRLYAETKQRKTDVDGRAVSYLTKRCPTIEEFNEAHDFYKELISPGVLE